MGLLELRDKLQKSCKGVHVSLLSDSEIANVSEWLKTPFYDLNRTISGDLFKGLPEKTLTLVVGQEHTFKSSFACNSMAEAQKQGYTCIILDTEGAWTKDFIKRWGVDPEKVLYIYTPWVDRVKVVLSQLIVSDEDKAAKKDEKKALKLKKMGKKKVEVVEEKIEVIVNEKEKYFIVLDSLGGLDKIKIVDDALEGTPKADQGTLQKEIKSMLKMLLNVVKSKDSIAVVTGHYYGNPSGYGDAAQVGGGFAAKLLPDIIIAFKKSKLMLGDQIVGNDITAITLKNRHYPPFNESKVELDYLEGINPFAGIINLAVDADIIHKGGAGWYTVGDWRKEGKEIVGGKKIQGDKALLDYLSEDKEAMQTLLETLNVWLKDTGFSSVNEEIKEAVESLENANVEIKEVEEDAE